MNDAIHITGGADEYHAAAILAVIHHVQTAATVPTQRNPNAQSAWLRAGRQSPIGRFQPPVMADPGLNWPTS